MTVLLGVSLPALIRASRGGGDTRSSIIKGTKWTLSDEPKQEQRLRVLVTPTSSGPGTHATCQLSRFLIQNPNPLTRRHLMFHCNTCPAWLYVFIYTARPRTHAQHLTPQPAPPFVRTCTTAQSAASAAPTLPSVHPNRNRTAPSITTIDRRSYCLDLQVTFTLLLVETGRQGRRWKGHTDHHRPNTSHPANPHQTAAPATPPPPTPRADSSSRAKH